MNPTQGFMETIRHLECESCGERVVVGRTFRDTWYGLCECETAILPRIRADVDFDNRHIDMTGSIDIPVESWVEVEEVQFPSEFADTGGSQ